MRAQTGALDSTVCEEQLPLPEGVASTAGPFRDMPNIERELSARLDDVERCRHCSTPPMVHLTPPPGTTFSTVSWCLLGARSGSQPFHTELPRLEKIAI